jgi:hypothetical protein
MVLTVIQEQLVAGGRLTEDRVDEIARLLSFGKRRQPGALLRHTPDELLERLAAAVLRTGLAAGHLAGYADWDGRDPAPAREEDVEKSFARPGNNSLERYDVVRGRAESGFST